MGNLQTLLDEIPAELLPAAWSTFDFQSFSLTKSLWDYQQDAMQRALKALWKYYDGGTEQTRKARFYQWYLDNNVDLPHELNVGKKRDNISLLSSYYPLTNGQIPYSHFINRMGFWMATGSGKTLVIVKTLELLWTLMQRGLIPVRDMLVLTHREDLLKQLHDHVLDFNSAGGRVHIQLRELPEYPEVKRSAPSLLASQETTVFYYRSDNLSDEHKERIIDFRHYDSNGQWYVLLDEAHKGDKQDSKRQHIYSILSRNGFLFNFSATFTDPRDVLTTASEFNLASFIRSGYGKHISILKQENRAFRDDEDFTSEEKQKIVLQSLLALAYINKSRKLLTEATHTSLYHRPLLLALVNSVNTEESDLKLFFRQLEKIGKGEISPQAFTAAKTALGNELASRPEWLYEDKSFELDRTIFESLTANDVLRFVFNADTPGEIEVLVHPSNPKELAFKLKTTPLPFALIKIGSIAEWLKGELAGYEVVSGFEDESFFARLNEEDSEVNLLMGSRSFYEGWDSNRPNVITFINIGVGEDARKFVLQSVGRGVRIEPLKGMRKRLESLHNAGIVEGELFNTARPFLPAVQSLLIFGTKRDTLTTIFEGLEQEEPQKEGVEIALNVNKEAIDDHPILIPVYQKRSGTLLVEEREPRKFELHLKERDLLKRYVEYLGDDRLLLAHHDLTPQEIDLLHKTLADPDNYFNPNTVRTFGQIQILLEQLTQYFEIVPEKLEGFKPLEDEINHFKHIRVLLEDIQNLQKKIDSVKGYKDPSAQELELKRQLRNNEINIDQYTAAVKNLARTTPQETFEYMGQPLQIKYVSTYYYLPLLFSENERIEYINHVIKVPSEVRFVNQLNTYLQQEDNLFKQYDWWLFSRTDEIVDRVVIPYYDPTINKLRDFHPDFVFWLAKGDQYVILFVDPKGMTASGYTHKIDGYKELFYDDKTSTRREFEHSGYRVTVALSMYTNDTNRSNKEYKEFWFDSPKSILDNVLPPKSTI